MNYQEQLSDDRWKAKRKLIIERDKNKCQECYNASYYKNFNCGLIFSNDISHGGTKTTIHNESFIVQIWDFNKNKIITTFTKNDRFSCKQNYVAIYNIEENNPQLLALRLINKNKIKLDISFQNKIAEQIASQMFNPQQLNNNLDVKLRWKISDETYDEIYRIVKKEDQWEFVIGLEVHHEYYQSDLLAWEYPPESLKTLCSECHNNLHLKTRM